jgi:hypothetical protein
MDGNGRLAVAIGAQQRGVGKTDLAMRRSEEKRVSLREVFIDFDEFG